MHLPCPFTARRDRQRPVTRRMCASGATLRMAALPMRLTETPRRSAFAGGAMRFGSRRDTASTLSRSAISARLEWHEPS